MTETITIEELKELIKENKIVPEALFSAESIKSDPVVKDLVAKAVAKLKKEHEEEHGADHIPDDELPDLSLDAGHPKRDKTDHSADHIPDNGDEDDDDASHIPD